MTLLSWLATASILTTYAYLGRTGRAQPFHIANATGACILAPINYMAGVPAQAALSAVFGAVGLTSLLRASASTRRQGVPPPR